MEINKSFKLLNIHYFKTKLGNRIPLKKNYRTVDNRFIPKTIQTTNVIRSNLEI